MASTWPKPILYLNIRDNGTDSILDVEDIDVKTIESSDDLKEVLLWCAKQANRGKFPYKTIVADTMTQLQAILVEEVCAKKEAALRAKRKLPGDFGSMTMAEWGLVAGDMKSVIMDMRNLPCESVFLAQERVFNAPDEEDDGLNQLDPEIGPRLSPSVKNDINASVSLILSSYIKLRIHKKTKDEERRVEKIYCLRVGPNPVYTTKIRKPKGIELPDFIEDPNFRKIKRIMKGKI